LMELGRFAEAQQAFDKALTLTMSDRTIYAIWGWTAYTIQGFAEGERILKKGLKAQPENSEIYYVLGRLYHATGKYAQAVQMYRKAVWLDPKNEIAYGGLRAVYIEMKDFQGAQDALAHANSVRLQFFNPIVRDNYLELKNILDKRKIKLVCVQYPMRNVEALKSLFTGKPGVVFVDNENIFFEAVRKTGCKDYFTDMFAGDFGHCTRKGYRLLAGNIADTILPEMFH